MEKTLTDKRYAALMVACTVLFLAGPVTAETKKAEPAKAKTIRVDADIEKDHPPFEEGITCNDCHEIQLDAGTTATQVWISGDYLNWQAGEGIMPKEKIWKRIVDYFKGKGMKRTFVIATSFNNRPYTFTADMALDPDKKVVYGFHEKGTEKLMHIRKNPYVSMNWHKEFKDDFNDMVCFQIIGKTELFEGTDKEFDEGFDKYPYEYAARQRNMTLDQWRAVIRKSMIMSRTTIERIRLTEGSLRKENFRTTQEWTP